MDRQKVRQIISVMNTEHTCRGAIGSKDGPITAARLRLHDCGCTIAAARLPRHDCGGPIAAARLRRQDCGGRIAAAGLRRHGCGGKISAARLRRHGCSGTIAAARLRRQQQHAPMLLVVLACPGGAHGIQTPVFLLSSRQKMNQNAKMNCICVIILL